MIDIYFLIKIIIGQCVKPPSRNSLLFKSYLKNIVLIILAIFERFVLYVNDYVEGKNHFLPRQMQERWPFLLCANFLANYDW